MHLRANGRKLLLFFHYSINPLLLMICGVLSTMMPLWSLTSQFLHWLLGNSVWLSGQSASLRFLRSWVQSRPKTCNRQYSMENSGGHMQHFHLHGKCKHLILLSKTLLEECTYAQKVETITLLSLRTFPLKRILQFNHMKKDSNVMNVILIMHIYTYCNYT